jgi:hypothetical protein
MAIVTPTPNIKFHLTGGINGATNTNPFLSLGGQMAAEIQSDKMDNLWDPVSGQDQRNGITEYRWIICYNAGTDPVRNAHFYFQPRDKYVEMEFSRLAVSAPVQILPTEEDRPVEQEIGPEVDVPMPWTKTGETYEDTQSIAPDIPAKGKLYICLKREIPKDVVSEPRAFVIICESRIPLAASTSASGSTQEET